MGECKNNLGCWLFHYYYRREQRKSGDDPTRSGGPPFGRDRPPQYDQRAKKEAKDDKYLYTVDVKSVISENVLKPVALPVYSLHHLEDSGTEEDEEETRTGEFEYRWMVSLFQMPEIIKQLIALFIVFRAALLGILTDKEIISFCTLQTNAEHNPNYVACIKKCHAKKLDSQ